MEIRGNTNLTFSPMLCNGRTSLLIGGHTSVQCPTSVPKSVKDDAFECGSSLPAPGKDSGGLFGSFYHLPIGGARHTDGQPNLLK